MLHVMVSMHYMTIMWLTTKRERIKEINFVSEEPSNLVIILLIKQSSVPRTNIESS